MAERVCVFVDGENFRHNIVDLFDQFDQGDYLPHGADWAALFNWLVQEASDGGNRVRTYWYVVEHLDFRPHNLPHFNREPDKLKKIVCRDPDMKAELSNAQDDEEASRKLTQFYSKLNGRRGNMVKRFDGWRRVHDEIARAHSAIEFRKAGSLRYDLLRGTLGPEKAVDVKLATDLIMFRDIYDVAVIISGDQDFVPAVQVVKDSGKRVINVAFKTQDDRLLPGGAVRLSQTTDWGLQIPHQDLANHLNL